MELQQTANRRGIVINVSGGIRVNDIIQVGKRFGEILMIEEDRLICESYPKGGFFEVKRRTDFDEPRPDEPFNEMLAWEGVAGVVVNAVNDGGEVYSDTASSGTAVTRAIAEVFESREDTVPLQQMMLILEWDEELARRELNADGELGADGAVPWQVAMSFLLAFTPYNIIADAFDLTSAGARINPLYRPTSITIEVPRFIAREGAVAVAEEIYDGTLEDGRPSYEADWSELEAVLS